MDPVRVTGRAAGASNLSDSDDGEEPVVEEGANAMQKRRAFGGSILALAGTVAFGLALPATGAAQNLGFGLKVNAGFAIPGGDLGDGDPGDVGLDGGPGFEATVSRAWASGFELGVGTGISFHDVGGVGENADLITVYAEPLYRFGVRADRTPHLHPFFGGRIGYARLSHPVDAASRSGFLAGPVGGVEYWLSDEVGLVGTAAFDFFNFGEPEAGGDDVGGSRFAVQGGLKVRFN